MFIFIACRNDHRNVMAVQHDEASQLALKNLPEKGMLSNEARRELIGWTG
jgi:hypothetical protein